MPLQLNTVGAALLVIVYGGLVSGADGITKFFAESFEAAQLYAFSGFIVAGFSLVATRMRGEQVAMSTRCPWAMAVRSVSMVIATVGFFYAFRLLPFADVFIFIALMPVFAALMAGPVLGERVSWSAWVALFCGVFGVYILVPAWGSESYLGAGIACGAALIGTFSVTVSRYIARYEDKSLLQVFYPNLTLGFCMAIVLPFVWQPMTVSDLMWVAIYSGFLFFARWILVVAVRVLPTYTVMPLLNLQFVWMVLVAIAVFGEIPPPMTYFGMVMVAGSGVFLVMDKYRREMRESC